MFKKKKIILAAGCSFTDPNFKSTLKHLPDNKRGGWPMWPELMQRKIEKETSESYELINLARSGASNDYILHTCIDALAKYDTRIKIVLIGGTQWMRTHVVTADTSFNPQVNLQTQQNFVKSYEKAMMQMWYQCSNNFGFQNTIHHNLRIMWTLMNICNDKKIKFIWNQLLSPFPGPDWWRKQLLKAGSVEGWEINTNLHAWEKLKETLRWTMSEQYFSETVLKSPHAKFLIKHKKYLYGFSWSNGRIWDNTLPPGSTQRSIICPPETVINGKKEVDFHPNKLGQKEIAEEMWKEYGNYLVKN